MSTRVNHRGPVTRARRSANLTLRSFVSLTKPRIIELLLITTVPVMFLAAGGVPPVQTVGATLVGGTLMAGSANVLNCYLDRDIDALMTRARGRPLVTGAVLRVEALVFGLGLGIVATAWLVVTVNWLSAALALGANIFYVLGYTLILKRRTPTNIVWGGAAGCMPTLIGWTAITGSLSWTPVVLFGVVFLWFNAGDWIDVRGPRLFVASRWRPLKSVVLRRSGSAYTSKAHGSRHATSSGLKCRVLRVATVMSAD